MSWMARLGEYIGRSIFQITIMVFGSVNKLLSDFVWVAVIKPMFEPDAAFPDISSGSAGNQTPLLESTLYFNEWFLTNWVTPLLLFIIIIIGILFMFGWFQGIRDKVKHSIPGIMFGVILAYTTTIWMDAILGIGRAMMISVYDALPRYLSPGWVELLFYYDSGAEGFWEGMASQLTPLVITSIMVTILILIGVAIAVRTAIVYTGIAIMPLMCIFLPVPFANAGAKKFIKIWIQSVFFLFFMAIPLILYGYASGWLKIGFLILTLGMPFLVSTGEVLAMRAAGYPSAGGAAKVGVLGGQLTAIGGPAMGMAQKGASMAVAAKTGGASMAASGGGKAGALTGSSGGGKGGGNAGALADSSGGGKGGGGAGGATASGKGGGFDNYAKKVAGTFDEDKTRGGPGVLSSNDKPGSVSEPQAATIARIGGYTPKEIRSMSKSEASSIIGAHFNKNKGGKE